ncbi:virulence factor [Alcaligenaceae bacterium]|nr:virulence factor [Alcaligenaceae bacterium]
MKRLLLLAGGAALAVLGSTAAMARVNVDISIGVPGVIYSEPYYPPVRYAPPPRVIVVPERRYYRPVQAYGPHYYREDYRGDRYYKKQHKHKHGHHKRGRHD